MRWWWAIKIEARATGINLVKNRSADVQRKLNSTLCNRIGSPRTEQSIAGRQKKAGQTPKGGIADSISRGLKRVIITGALTVNLNMTAE